jgi:microcystin-dependent protein
MAGPTLTPINLTANGDTFQYAFQLVNNLNSWATQGVYANGAVTAPNANVAVDGEVRADRFLVTGNTGNVQFYTDAGVLVGRIGHDIATDTIFISSSNTTNMFQLYSNGAAYSANVRLATVNDLTASTNTLNASIVANSAVAFANSVAYTNAAVPSGVVQNYAGATAPTGWFECNGAAVSRTTYATLFTAIGTAFGAGNGTTTFNVPDLRGEFVRGWDNGRGVDSGRARGSAQAQSMQSHTHTGTTVSAGNHSHSASADTQGAHSHGVADPGHSHAVGDPGHSHDTWAPFRPGPLSHDGTDEGDSGVYANGYNGRTGVSLTGVFLGASITNISLASAGSHSHNISVTAAGAHTHTFTTDATGSAETRPRNVAMMYIIKA